MANPRRNSKTAQQIAFAMRTSGSLKWLPGLLSKTVLTPFASKAATTRCVPSATPRKGGYGVRASFDPSEKYTHRSGRSNSPASTYSAKFGYHIEPDALATASNRSV